MAFFIFVNGNPVHDEGEHDADLRVTRSGGGPLSFKTRAEAERAADALFARQKKQDAELPLTVRRSRPARSAYVVASEAPASDPPVDP